MLLTPRGGVLEDLALDDFNSNAHFGLLDSLVCCWFAQSVKQWC